ncbi:hypothetical protein [Pseudalkalibacillus sp. SCS-8]|uniref:hypothetical protein n=1 Tax=Pseudalkalibacillus nanhaiensis TaxID=3115291 RepID=UPI0032DA6C4D
MRKGFVSILLGVLIGVSIAYFTLDYNGWTFMYPGPDGEAVRTIHELDVDLLLDGTLIVVGVSAFIYTIWTMIEKGKRNREVQ